MEKMFAENLGFENHIIELDNDILGSEEEKLVYALVDIGYFVNSYLITFN